jgi:demethylmenaquinone methyltransferase/2-methoxy-6-polyprenyl-1,4-benzoquinol methylase
VILETSVPDKNTIQVQFYSKISYHLLVLFSKDNEAYGYLSESAAAFPYGEH